MESITHARAHTVGAGRGGAASVVTKRTSRDVVAGRQPCDEREERELALVAGRRAEGELENVRRAVRASCAFFRSPRRRPGHYTAVSVAERSVGGTPLCESAAAPPPLRKFVRACARALPCALVTSRPPTDGRTVMWRCPPERTTTKRDIGVDGRTGAARSSPLPTTHTFITIAGTTLAKRNRLVAPKTILIYYIIIKMLSIHLFINAI